MSQPNQRAINAYKAAGLPIPTPSSSAPPAEEPKKLPRVPHPLEGGEPTFRSSNDAPPEHKRATARTDLRLRVAVWILDCKPGQFFIIPNSSLPRTRGIYCKLARHAAADLGNKVQVEVYGASEGVVVKRLK